MHLFSNILGIFVFDEQFNLVDKILFKDIEDCKNKEKLIEKIRHKHKAEEIGEEKEEILKKALLHFKGNNFFNEFYNKNLQLTKRDVKNSVNSDALLIQAVNSINELNKSANTLAKRLREWYGLHNPEYSGAIESHEKFVEEILEKEKGELLKELKIAPTDSIGADLEQEDLEPIRGLTHQIYNLYQLRKSHEAYLSALMDELCPNIKAVCGIIAGAQLVGHAGSLKRLSEMPASTIQVLGAEKALFRHIKTGAKPPRHGVIANHPLIAKSPNPMHGRIARVLADKIAIASRIDYFHGKFIGDKLKEELISKFGMPY